MIPPEAAECAEPTDWNLTRQSRRTVLPAEILDGRALAQQVRRQVAAEVAELTARTGVVPGLTVVLVGDDPASQVYVRNKGNACKTAGMNRTVLRLPTTTTHVSRSGHCRPTERRSRRPWHPGPVAATQANRRFLRGATCCAPLKDVDGFHPFNFGLLAAGTPRFVPCTPLGIRELLVHSSIETRGARGRFGAFSNRGQTNGVLLLQKGRGRRDRNDLPCTGNAQCGRLCPPGRPAHRGHGPTLACHLGIGQTRGGRYRRRYPQTRRQPTLRRRSLPQRRRGRIADHARAWRCRSVDNRDVAQKHTDGGF